MSVRIYQLSKELGMDNSELISLLKDRGHVVKSASSTVDNISAESLREEFGTVADDADTDPTADPSKVAEEPMQSRSLAPEVPVAVVRTREEIEKERKDREAEEESRKQESASAKTFASGPQLSGKVPPPLPAIPPLQRKMPVTPAITPKLTPGSGSSAPVVRTDMPAPVTPVVQPPISPSPVAPPKTPPPVATPPVAPPRMGPPPTQPPKAPPPVAPPSVAPPSVAPPPVAPPHMGPPPIQPPKAPPPVAPPPVAPPRMGPPPIQPPKAPPPAVPPVGAASDRDALSSTNEESGIDIEGEVSAEAASNLRPLQVRSPIVVRDFAILIGRKPFQLISELMELSIFASMNSAIEEEIAERVARNHGYALEVRHRNATAQAEQVAKEVVVDVDDAALQEPRPPIVCILGHVDHGKTTLLDAIRNANVVAGEAGGITQHIGAYQIVHKDNPITFIDTPGHSAFSNMRARGATTTDIAVLVVAADDGFMPQTDEALKHAQKAGVPVVVAINKMDAPGVNLDKVYRQMQERGLSPEDWGGETLSAKVSALKKQGIEDLLDIILLQAEVTEGITANPNGPARGVVLEAQKELGRGSTASVIIQQGTLKTGAALVCGELYCRVRQIIDDTGKVLKSARPGQPVKIVGWSGPPCAGDNFKEVKNERMAKREAEENELARKKLEADELKEAGSASLDDLFAAIERTQKKTYRVLVKADVYGTAEALATTLMTIKSDKIDLDVVDMGVGDITRNDIAMADATQASVVGFNVGMENGIVSFAKHKNVTIIQHRIIYELIDQVKAAMADLLEPELRENKIGAAEVRAIFPLGKGFVAGCMVIEGRIQRDALARIMRGGKLVHQSRIGTLKRFKDDATEVRAGYECGVQVEGTNTYEEKDIIEVFEILKIKPEL